MDRNEFYNIAVKYLESSKRLICQWATGTGKSQVALRFVNTHPGIHSLIVVPEADNIKNWRNEFKKFSISDDNVDIICYASLHKYKNTEWDLLVLDEMPHMDTDKRKEILNTVKSQFVLALGAVITFDERQSLESVYGPFVKSEISIEQAIKMNILPIPIVNIVHLKFDEQRRYWVNGKYINQKQHYDIIHKKVENAVNKHNETKSAFFRKKMFTLGDAKTAKAKEICQMLQKKGKRFLCFCSSIQQTVDIGGELSFTSLTPTSKKLLDKFNSKEINSLYVVGKLIEGQNLVDIDCGIIVQLGGTDRITVQEIGRILRSENPVVYVLVFDDTKDDGFLYTLTSNIPKEYIKHYNF